MFYWSFTSLIHFWPPQFLILVTPMRSASPDGHGQTLYVTFYLAPRLMFIQAATQTSQWPVLLERQIQQISA